MNTPLNSLLFSLGPKFQLKLIILSFLDQICPKRVFPVENRKTEPDN